MAEASSSGGPAPNSLLAGRRLAAELRRLRIASLKRWFEIGSATDIGPVKLKRIEAGEVTVTKQNLVPLLNYYGVAEADHGPWIELTLQAKQRGPYDHYNSDVSRRLRHIYEFTDSAAGIEVCSGSVPPLLQTPGSAGAFAEQTAAEQVLRTGKGDVSELTERLVALNAQRRQVLQRANPPRILAVLSGLQDLMPGVDDAVKGEQLNHLIELAQQPNVTIRVLPRESALPEDLSEAELPSDFVIVGFPDPTLDPPGCYVENPMNVDLLDEHLPRFTQDPKAVAELQNRFSAMTLVALNSDESLQYLEDLIAAPADPSERAAPARRHRADATGRPGTGRPGAPRRPGGHSQ